MAYKKPKKDCQHVTVRDVNKKEWQDFRVQCMRLGVSVSHMIRILIKKGAPK